MHIHRIKSGNKTKLLLRASYRDGSRVRKVTIENVTKWSKEAVETLTAALVLKRIGKNTLLERDADRWIFEIFQEQGWSRPHAPYQLICSLSAERIYRGGTKSGMPEPESYQQLLNRIASLST